MTKISRAKIFKRSKKIREKITNKKNGNQEKSRSQEKGGPEEKSRWREEKEEVAVASDGRKI